MIICVIKWTAYNNDYAQKSLTVHTWIIYTKKFNIVRNNKNVGWETFWESSHPEYCWLKLVTNCNRANIVGPTQTSSHVNGLGLDHWTKPYALKSSVVKPFLDQSEKQQNRWCAQDKLIVWVLHWWRLEWKSCFLEWRDAILEVELVMDRTIRWF